MKSAFRVRILLPVALLGLAACANKSAPPAPAPPPEVGVVTVHPENAPLTRDLVGRLTAFRSADVRARVAGVLIERAYKEGTEVARDQVLFRIDPAPLRAALNASLATLAQSQASYTNSHVAAERARELAPKGFVSKSDLDNAEAAERTAAAAVKQAKANVDSARINLGYATVRAPIAGRAGKQQVTEGALVGQSDATLLTTVEQIDPLYVNFTIGVDDLESMRRAAAAGKATLAAVDKAEVRVALPDGSDYGRAGTLDFSDTAVDPATGAVSLRAQIPNPDHALLPGMYVTLTASLGVQHGVFLVPQAALLRDAVGAYVLVVGADDKVARKDVAAGTARGGDWIVTGGLADGDRVIVSGVQRAKTGQPAKATPWQAEGAAPAASSAGAKSAPANR